MQEVIEILPVSLLDEERQTVDALKKLAGSLRLEFGWHYLLDLTWIIRRLENIQGQHILDAGAGTGVLQWFLAAQGGIVLSVDRASRVDLPLRFRRRFDVSGLRESDLAPVAQVLRHNLGSSRQLAAQARDLLHPVSLGRSPGRVVIYQQDLKTLAGVGDGSLDAVVAVSALEHNPPGELASVVAELLRVLKPGGILLATLGAARDQDWFHTPSQGWCYTECSLRQAFDLPGAASNYNNYDALFAKLRDCTELRDGLASFYLHSGDNGMPWGNWDPQYPPVGVCKVKPTNHT